VIFNTFTFIYGGFRVLSAAFAKILLFATMCHTSALNSWHVLTVLLTYITLHEVNMLAWIEADVYGSATTRQILKCTHYKRSLHAHIYSYRARQKK